jgi:hypothetical protein
MERDDEIERTQRRPILRLVTPPETEVARPPSREFFARQDELGERRWRGTDRSGRRVLITAGQRLKCGGSKAEPALKLEAPGVSALRYLGPGDEYEWGTLCVEDEPPGAPLTARQLGARDAAGVGAAIADVVAGAHERGLVLGGVRPEAVYLAGPRGARPRVALAPRFLPFWRSCRDPETGLGWPLRFACESPEVCVGKAATAASDVFSLALLVAWLVDVREAGGPPLEGFVAKQWYRLATGGAPHVAPMLAPVLAPALARTPAQRPTAATLRDELRRVAAS